MNENEITKKDAQAIKLSIEAAKDKRIAELEAQVKKYEQGETDLLIELDAKSFILNNALAENGELRKRIAELEVQVGRMREIFEETYGPTMTREVLEALKEAGK